MDELPRILTFRQTLVSAVRASPAQRRTLAGNLVDSIRQSEIPGVYLAEVLNHCGSSRHPDALDLGVDVLSAFGDHLVSLWRREMADARERWRAPGPNSLQNDDRVYMLLRALARSTAPENDQLAAIEDCLRAAPRDVREAAAHALGDWGGSTAEARLRQLAEHDPDRAVRETAQELLEDCQR